MPHTASPARSTTDCWLRSGSPREDFVVLKTNSGGSSSAWCLMCRHTNDVGDTSTYKTLLLLSFDFDHAVALITHIKISQPRFKSNPNGEYPDALTKRRFYF